MTPRALTHSDVQSMNQPPFHFERYVAIGDSSTEGLKDDDGQGGYRGWSQRLAERIAHAQGSLLYANLAVRGCRTRQVRDEQLAAALAMRPDLRACSAEPTIVSHEISILPRSLTTWRTCLAR